MDNILLALTIGSTACYVFGYFRMPFIFTGLILQIAYLSVRGVSLDRIPLVGPHDTLYFMSASIVLFALPVSWRMKERRRVLNASVAMAVFFVALSLLYKPHNSPLPPVLQTFWFETHVVLSFFAYALFGIAAILGGIYLRDRQREFVTLQYKAILVGYCFFSIAMIFGGIWAYLAWGTYWLWTPKELWTVILWLFYSLYLHARLSPWWMGRPVSILAIAGFFIVMFTYLGVSLFMKSSHSF